MPFSTSKTLSAIMISVLLLSGCQQTVEHSEQRNENRKSFQSNSDQALTIPTEACAEFLSSGVLPANKLTAAGFSKSGKVFERKLAPRSFSIPTGSTLHLRTRNNGACTFSVTYGSFRLPFARVTVHNSLVKSGWTHQGSLIYSKNGNRIEIQGSETSHGVISIGLYPL